MPTDKQRTARRNNAHRSKGPVTEEGKAASSRNAIKFGFYSRSPLLPGEAPEEFAAFRDELMASFNPGNAAEKLVFNRIVDGAWRLHRLPFVEASIFAHQIHKDEAQVKLAAAEALIPQAYPRGVAPDETDNPEEYEALLNESDAAEAAAGDAAYTMGRAFIRDTQSDHCFTALARCEAAIDRAMLRQMKQLETMQAKRNQKVTKIPAGREKVKLRNDLTDGSTPLDTAA
jgi:hypothetical protein